MGHPCDGLVSRLQRWYVQPHPALPFASLSQLLYSRTSSSCTYISSSSSSESCIRCLAQVTVMSDASTCSHARVRCGHAHRICAHASAVVSSGCAVWLWAVLLRDEPPCQGQRGASAAAPAAGQRECSLRAFVPVLQVIVHTAVIRYMHCEEDARVS